MLNRIETDERRKLKNETPMYVTVTVAGQYKSQIWGCVCLSLVGWVALAWYGVRRIRDVILLSTLYITQQNLVSRKHRMAYPQVTRGMIEVNTFWINGF